MGRGPLPSPPVPTMPVLTTCCCGRCMLRTGSICTGVFFMVYRLGIAAALVVALIFFDDINDDFYDKKKQTFWIVIVVAIVVNGLDFLVSVIMTFGAASGRSLPVLIWIVYETLNVVFLVVAIVVCMILTEFRTHFIVAFVTSLVLSALNLYLILAVVSYYQLLGASTVIIAT